jgi:hypothetical protein
MNFQQSFEKCLKSSFIKIRQLGAELFHVDRRTTDRQTDRHDKAKFRFSQFCDRV